jgi:hypothetical protein
MLRCYVYLDVVIIGAGPIGITAFNSFRKNLNIRVFSPSDQFKFDITHDSNLKLSTDSASGTVLGNIPKWGNQHDSNFNLSQDASEFSDLPGFIFPLEELSMYNKKIKRMGWPSARNPSKYVLKPHKEFIYEPKNCIYFRDLTLIQKVDYRYVLSVDGKLFFAKKIVFATGGLSNIFYASEVIEKFYPNLIKFHESIGVGYTNHPKKIIGTIVFRKPIQFKKIRFKKNLIIVNRFNNPHSKTTVSYRFWPIYSLDHKLLNVNRILNLIGFSRSFKIMSYFEFPQLRKSRVEFIKKVDKTLIFKINVHASKDLLLFYEKSIKQLLERLKLSKNFISFTEENTSSEFIHRDSNHHMGGTRQGNNPSNSVVDEHGKMHSTDGIYFVGTSVLPVSRSEHPTMLAAFLALRSVEHIESELRHE